MVFDTEPQGAAGSAATVHSGGLGTVADSRGSEWRATPDNDEHHAYAITPL